MNLKGKVALVTGAAQGLGKGFTEALLQRGAKVALLDIKMLAGKETTKKLASMYGKDNVVFLPCDVTAKDGLESAFRQTITHFGQLDLVVNNAGISECEKNWEMGVDINLKSVIHGTLLGLDHMSMEKGGKGGLIINIASIAGLLAASHGPVYAATKHGVVGLSRSFGTPFHLDRTGVRVCAMCPSFTDTPMQLSRVAPTREDQIMHDAYWASVESEGGLLQVSDVVDGFLQLVDDDSKNGAVMRITKQKGVDYQPYGAGGQGASYATRRKTRSKI